MLTLLSMLLAHVTTLAPTSQHRGDELSGDDNGAAEAAHRELCSWILFACKFVNSTLQVRPEAVPRICLDRSENEWKPRSLSRL